MRKIVSLFLVFLLTVSLLAACGGSEGSSGSSKDKTKISVLIGKPEVIGQFEDMVKEFNSTHDIEVSVIPLAGQNSYEKMTSLYSSNNAPTIMMMASEFEEFGDKLLDLSDQEWVEHAQPGSLEFMKKDDKYYGMPVTVEAFGYIYNQQVLDEAVGSEFDPATVKTRDELKDLFDKVAALDGKEAIHVSPMDWSLGAHLTNIPFATQSTELEERHQFLQDAKDGNVEFANNDKFNGWMDTFDLMKEYNSTKDAPLAPQYDEGPLSLASGEVGLWFMGNWAYPQIKEVDPEGEYGFLPVPISNNAEDYGNSEISVGVPSYWTVDESQSTEEEQQAALEFLDWMVFGEGQDAYVNELNFIPVYDNIDAAPQDTLSQSIVDYMDAGKTLEWVNLYYPADAWPAMGAPMQKYLADEIDREGLFKEFNDYWSSK
ncbi:ABC transporter substrate-binding protein [Bacillus marinisedimentorum]|uniref:ABC transporter substrate-binding protein n=1 Tax=Bacillus marinisedimentorum TaxID=1821260 RepID=UPI0007DFC429|nr:ABC transporter substrate-binding protein [Bacillus marinisedimentorum]